MKYADINKRFTEIVAEYIGKGYTINSSSMRGSQGETAKVDLTNGTEIIRVMINSFNEWNEISLEGEEIIVGRAHDDVVPHDSGCFNTIWNGNLEVLSCERFYTIGAHRTSKEIYGTKAEAEAVARLRYARSLSRTSIQKPVDITDKAMEIGKRVVRRKFGVKRVSAADVRVLKHKGSYIVEYKSRTYRLH